MRVERLSRGNPHMYALRTCVFFTSLSLGGETRVPAKLVDLDPQAHKFTEIWGWRIVFGEYFSADVLHAPFQYRWVKTANSSNGDADQGAAGQSVLENINWNLSSGYFASKSRIWRELKDGAEMTSGRLSIRFNVDAFNKSPQTSYYGLGRITGMSYCHWFV